MATFSWETVQKALSKVDAGAEVLKQIQQTLPGAVATAPTPITPTDPVPTVPASPAPPAPPKAPPPAPVRTSSKKASKLSTTTWIAIGAGGLVVAGGLAYLLSRPPAFRRR